MVIAHANTRFEDPGRRWCCPCFRRRKDCAQVPVVLEELSTTQKVLVLDLDETLLVFADREALDRVIGNLIDSIFAQDYPKDLMKVFVCADNCTDDTAKIARERGAVVFERYSNERGKSYALDYMIKRVLAEYAEEKFDAAYVLNASIGKNWYISFFTVSAL